MRDTFFHLWRWIFFPTYVIESREKNYRDYKSSANIVDKLCTFLLLKKVKNYGQRIVRFFLELAPTQFALSQSSVSHVSLRVIGIFKTLKIIAKTIFGESLMVDLYRALLKSGLSACICKRVAILLGKYSFSAYCNTHALHNTAGWDAQSDAENAS